MSIFPVFCSTWTGFFLVSLQHRRLIVLLSILLPLTSCRASWFLPSSCWSNATHCHPARGPLSESIVVWEADPRVPRLCRRTEELLTPMDFSFVDVLGSMSCFCLPRWRPWIGISFHRYSSLLVFLCLYVCIWTGACFFFFKVSLIFKRWCTFFCSGVAWGTSA